MKIITTIAIIALASSALATSPTPAPTPAKHRAKKVDESEKPPFVGMTKAQAIARYGQPKKQTVTDEGENWVYVLNFGEFVGKHMIPFFFRHFADPDRRVDLRCGQQGEEV
jgi:hypothetical protein